MKKEIESRKPQNFLDYLALSITTFGVGYLPLMPGTYGSAVGVLIYLAIANTINSFGFSVNFRMPDFLAAWITAAVALFMVLFCLLGIWAAGRSTGLLGNSDPSQAVVDEVLGQLIVFLFVPFGISWPFILAGFLLFRLFDIWKPYPIRSLENLPGGIGICADDMVAGVYGGICLALIYAVSYLG